MSPLSHWTNTRWTPLSHLFLAHDDDGDDDDDNGEDDDDVDVDGGGGGDGGHL